METSFEQVYETYAADVYRFALYLAGNSAQAEDITSETFVRAWTAREPIRSGTIKAYLFAIARNLYRAGLRHDARRQALADSLPDHAPGLEESTSARLELAAVLAALQKLPELDRAALVMRAQHGMSHEQIAAALGLSTVAARVKIHRARLKLEELLEERKHRHERHP